MEQINNYIDSLLLTEDTLLGEVVSSIRENGMPAMSVSSSTGKLLSLLVSTKGAKKILEIGALGGYSGICLARGFVDKGNLISLELEEKYAALAKDNLIKAGFGEQVSYLVGPALESLEQLVQSTQTFDFFFIDADKQNYENYLEYCIKLAEPGALILSDNVLAGGSVIDPTAKSKHYTEYMKNYNELVASHPKLESILVPIGDGIMISKVITSVALIKTEY